MSEARVMNKKKLLGLLMATMMCSALQGASIHPATTTTDMNLKDASLPAVIPGAVIVAALCGGVCINGRAEYAEATPEQRQQRKQKYVIGAGFFALCGTENALMGNRQVAMLQYSSAAACGATYGRMLWWDRELARQGERAE
jgi:hypothetical protein